MKRINLLPKLKQRELAHERILHSVSVAATLAVVLLLFGVVVQFGVWTFLDRTMQSVDTEIELLKGVANKSENAVVKQDIKTANAQIEDFSKLAALTPQWSKVLAAFVQHVPAGVKITEFNTEVSTTTGLQEITISGYSPTRDLVIDLYNNINADKTNFKDIDYPLENVTQPVDVRFFFTFTIPDGVLAGGVK